MSVIAAISPDIFTPWSDRALTHELTPDDGLTVYRDGNKTLHVADPVGGLVAAKKYRLTISGDDLWGFAYGGMWVGTPVTVDLAVTIWTVVAANVTALTLERDIVAGSVVARTKDGADLAVTDVTARVVTVAAHADQVAFIGYRPRLVMLVSEPWALRFERDSFTSSNSIVLREV